jgi:hypothetical protein
MLKSSSRYFPAEEKRSRVVGVAGEEDKGNT